MGKGNPGKLRIYLGSAAGVGKTYAMLCEGHRRAERGTDVVVGFVETHGRPHTEPGMGYRYQPDTASPDAQESAGSAGS